MVIARRYIDMAAIWKANELAALSDPQNKDKLQALYDRIVSDLMRYGTTCGCDLPYELYSEEEFAQVADALLDDGIKFTTTVDTDHVWCHFSLV